MGSRSSMLCAPGKMLKEKASAIGNVIVPEVARWFHKRFEGKCSAPEARKMLRLAFLQKPNAKREPMDQMVQSDCADVSVCDVVRGSGGTTPAGRGRSNGVRQISQLAPKEE